MKQLKWMFIPCCLLLVAGCAKKITPESSGTSNTGSTTVSGLRIMTYNIHHANPPSRPNVIDMAAIANVIKQQQPDLVALQEVDVHTNRSGSNVDEAAEIARQSNMPYYYFAKAIDYDGGAYGVAILSKYPMEQTSTNPLPTEPSTNGEHRTLALATIQLPLNKKIVFACTHLDAQSNDTNRLLQIRKIVEIMGQQTLPVVIGGDFNAAPTNPVIGILDGNFTRTCVTGCGFTIPQVNPNKTIDYLAFKPAGAFKVLEHQVVDEKYASDHLPVRAVLKVE